MATILIDVDDVVCTNHFVPVVNDYLKKNYKEDDFKIAHLEQEIFPSKQERDKFNDFYITVDSYEKCELKKGCYEVLKRLITKYRILFLTSACHDEKKLEFGRQFTDKWNFLLTKLPFFAPENIIFAAQKDVFIADMLVDDRLENLKGNYKYKVLFTCFHNKNISDEKLTELGILRVNDWFDLEKLIDKVFQN